MAAFGLPGGSDEGKETVVGNPPQFNIPAPSTQVIPDVRISGKNRPVQAVIADEPAERYEVKERRVFGGKNFPGPG